MPITLQRPPPQPTRAAAFSRRHHLLLTLVAATLSWLAVMQAQAAERIVIAGGDLTEIVFALDEGHRVVGVDTTSTYPASLEALPSIGYVRTLSPEGVLSLRPEMVLASHFAGPDATLARLRAAGVSLLQAPAPNGKAAEDVSAKIRFVGEALGRESAADRLANRFESELAEVQRRIDVDTHAPRVLFVLSADSGPMIIGGKGTVAESMIRMAGGKPLTGGITGYRPLSMESVISLQPDIVLMMAEQLEGGSPQTILQRPDLADTPAGQQQRLITMEGMLLLGYGPRTPLAIRQLHESIVATMNASQGASP
ncbi:ABC transporter substrate-binding protein [Halomonas campisalis]|uniref:ABC transporter substrate-binding protein n=1 Tax=Billgrantia campisalis TaxID=74661 RepID=A0ABS9PAL4_9GAMM|nr:ABC transporter substrate-binding protein [Halomonas campisalis]MCG6658805.1 ABC transporter substrate-binding protein [Halomonas campisalis]MDR5864768.1 ABC transporter substrate-binding protein [Halomonas campisalis]